MARLRTRLPVYAVLGVVVSMAGQGCGIVAPDEGGVRDLDEARDLWRRNGQRDYRFQLERRCFCLPESLGPAIVTVHNSVLVTGVVRTSDGTPMPEEYARAFTSVLGLFDLIEDALARDAAVVEVSYAPDTGMPVDVWIDYSLSIADEEVGYAAGSLEPLS